MSDGIGPVVTFGIGDDTFAIPVGRVQEILEMAPILHLPGAPGHVLGVIDVRGQGVSVVDLRQVMRLGPGVDDEATRIIVVLVGAEGRQARVAMRADRVFEVSTFDEDRTEPVPEAELLSWDDALLSGIGRRDGRFVALLDLDRMFRAFPASRADGAAPSADPQPAPAGTGRPAVPAAATPA